MLFPLYDHNPHRRIPWFTLLIIAVNIGAMIWLSGQSTQETLEIVYRHGFVPKRISQLSNGQPLVVPIAQRDPWGKEIPGAPPHMVKLPADPREIYSSFLTTMFLHGGWTHLAMNMWMLWVFGNNVEDRLGHFMFLCYYLVGGMVGTLSHWAIDQSSTIPVVGASGAVATILGGYAVTYPTAKVRTLVFIGIPLLLDLPALVVLGFWFIMQMVAGLGLLPEVVGMPVAFWAHIGGFVAGVVLLPFLALGAAPPERDWKSEADAMFRFDDPRVKRDDATPPERDA